MGRGQGHIIFYNCDQLGHLERDCHNPCTTCTYCNSFDHVIEDCPLLFAKVQERQGGNQKVQKISAKPHDEESRVVIIDRGGVVSGKDRVTPGRTTYGSWI